MIKNKQFELLHCNSEGVEDDNYEKYIVRHASVDIYNPEVGILRMHSGSSSWTMKVNHPQRGTFKLWLKGHYDQK